MNPYLIPIFIPKFPTDNDKPPTIYAILESIVNYGKEEKTKISDLAKTGRTSIFDFDYPLTSNVNKEEFESLILNKFLMRRIGFETVTAFKIQLNVKLHEIMPLYNRLFDAIEGWDLFESGEVTTREVTDNRIINNENTSNSTNETTNDNTISTNSETNSDRRFSEMPQNELENIKDGTYLTEYNLDKNTDTSNTEGNSTSNSTLNTTNNSNTTDNNTINETIRRTPSDKINIYKQFIESKNNVYTMIFKDLDSLFYQLV